MNSSLSLSKLIDTIRKEESEIIRRFCNIYLRKKQAVFSPAIVLSVVLFVALIESIVGTPLFAAYRKEEQAAGDNINIVRPSTKEWIDRLGMNCFGGGLGVFGWKPGSRDLVWDRVIKSVDGNRVEVYAPVTTAIEAQFGGGFVQRYSRPGRISRLGVENLRCESSFDPGNPKDEAHSWTAVTMENVENAWVRQVTMMHFAGSAVAVWETAKKVTVRECLSLAPISEDGGYRRHSFFTMGQLTLFLHCFAEYGRHDFSVGHCAAGPNAFVQCEAVSPLDDSGPIESWSSGTLYDNINIEGGALRLCNRGSRGQGIGWAAANSVLWQSAVRRSSNATILRRLRTGLSAAGASSRVTESGMNRTILSSRPACTPRN